MTLKVVSASYFNLLLLVILYTCAWMRAGCFAEAYLNH